MKFIYPAVFRKTDRGTYKGFFPDLAECYGEGETLDEAIEEAAKTPFTREVQLGGIPPKCNFPALTSIFDGTTCAIQHIKAYVRCMLQ